MSRIAASTLLLFVVLSSLAAKDNPSPDLRAHGEHKKRGQSDLPDRERGTRVRIKYRQSRQPECFPHVQRISVDGVFQTPRGSTKPIAPLERCAKMVTAPSAAARAKSGNFSSTSREKRACGIVHGAGVLSGEIVSTISRISQFATAKAFGCTRHTGEPAGGDISERWDPFPRVYNDRMSIRDQTEFAVRSRNRSTTLRAVVHPWYLRLPSHLAG